MKKAQQSLGFFWVYINKVSFHCINRNSVNIIILFLLSPFNKPPTLTDVLMNDA